MSLERIVNVRPAYDCVGVKPCVHGSDECTNGGPRQGHGRHNAELHMTVRGLDAEVTLVVGTGWDLPTVPDHHAHRGPKAAFVELHTARPRYEGQESYREPKPGDSCYGWAACYVDTGYLMADEPTRLLVEKGSDATWKWLEDLYAETQADIDRVAVHSEISRG